MKVLLNVTEQLTAKMMENYILASGAEAMVLSASSKETLLELTASYQPDIFAYYLTDDDTISLNELFAAVKRLCPRTRTLLVAGKNKMAATDEMAEGGFDEYIAVPVEISEVMLRLRRLFRQLQNDTPAGTTTGLSDADIYTAGAGTAFATIPPTRLRSRIYTRSRAER